MASLTLWTRVSKLRELVVDREGDVLQSMGLQRFVYD